MNDASFRQQRDNDLELVNNSAPNDDFYFLFKAADSKLLKTLLSFAVGGLLGDVFLHLLPEAWEYDMKERTGGEC